MFIVQYSKSKLVSSTLVLSTLPSTLYPIHSAVYPLSSTLYRVYPQHTFYCLVYPLLATFNHLPSTLYLLPSTLKPHLPPLIPHLSSLIPHP